MKRCKIIYYFPVILFLLATIIPGHARAEENSEDRKGGMQGFLKVLGDAVQGSLQDELDEFIGTYEGRIGEVTLMERRGDSVTFKVHYDGVKRRDRVNVMGEILKSGGRLEGFNSTLSPVQNQSGSVKLTISRAQENSGWGLPSESITSDQIRLSLVRETNPERPFGMLIYDFLKTWTNSSEIEMQNGSNTSKAEEEGTIELAEGETIEQGSKEQLRPLPLIRPGAVIRPVQVGTVQPSSSTVGITKPDSVKIVSPAVTTIQKSRTDDNKTITNFRTMQFKPLTAVQIKRPALLKLEKLKPIVPSSETVKPEGPDPLAVLDLNDVIDDSSILEDLEQACGWDSHMIFQDIAAPGVFYYIPREFLLKRDKDKYRFSVQYNTQAEGAQPSVTMTAEMEAPQRTGDAQLLKAILRQALGLKPQDSLTIKALPGLGSTADFQALATGLKLPSERITLSPPAHLKQVFRLTLLLTQDETEEVLAQIAGDGIAGNLNVSVKETVVPIPIRIRYDYFSGSHLEGFDKWIKGDIVTSFQNLTDFPILIEAINAYRVTGGKLERLHKKLNPATISPGKARLNNLPGSENLLGKSIEVAWLTSSLDQSCDECLKQIELKARKGISLSPGSRIRLEAIPGIFEEFGLYKLIIHIESPYFTVEGATVRQEEVSLTIEENEDESLMIFVPSDRGKDPLLYRYRIEAVTETGETRIAPEWQDAGKLTQFFGSSHLKDLFKEMNNHVNQEGEE